MLHVAQNTICATNNAIQFRAFVAIFADVVLVLTSEPFEVGGAKGRPVTLLPALLLHLRRMSDERRMTACFPGSVAEATKALQRGECSALDLVETGLASASDSGGEGKRTFIKLYARQAREDAKFVDRRLASGPIRPLEGVPVAVKDLFDVEGDTTTAGSASLRHRAAADRDAVAIARLRAVGAVLVGRTNMTEFAYSGLGLNPHFGTPLNPYDRRTGRIPGGSSSGAAVSVADGMCLVAVASDTGGSARTPAALCGLTGLKPTAAAIPMDGVFPLSPSLDSIGVIARTVECCRRAFMTMSGHKANMPEAVPIEGLRLLVPETVLVDQLDPDVSAAFEHALHTLSMAGVRVQRAEVRALERLPRLRARGGFPAAEAYRHLAEIVDRPDAKVDPRVRMRVLQGRDCSEADYEALCCERAAFREDLEPVIRDVDVIVAPTVPCIAPTLSDADDAEEHEALNALMLRNTAWVNLVDGCAVTVPCHEPGQAPVGLMLAKQHGADKRLLAVAETIETELVRSSLGRSFDFRPRSNRPDSQGC